MSQQSTESTSTVSTVEDKPREDHRAYVKMLGMIWNLGVPSRTPGEHPIPISYERTKTLEDAFNLAVQEAWKRGYLAAQANARGEIYH